MDSNCTTGFGYADRLKPKRKLGGQLGAEEYQESVESVAGKADDLAKLIQGSQEVFIFTGAGISTSMGIPDFRGPNGIWTARKKKQPISALCTPFEYYRPSFTHMAIAALVAAGKVKCVCSQNVDCLHLRSGIPRSLLAELHGNCFAERCKACQWEYTRDFQVETVNFQPTGRLCVSPVCGSRDAKVGCRPPSLLDNVLDWDSALPDEELDAAIYAAKRSELTLVLGSSLQISPANEIPTLTPQTKRGKGKEKGRMVIVNLQKTPKDRSAHMLVRARVDPVFSRIMLQLGLAVPPYIRLDGLVLSHAHLPTEAAATTSAASVGSTWGFKLALHSVHGQACVMPMVRCAKLELLPGDGWCSNSQAATACDSRAATAEQQQPSSDSLMHAVHVQLLCSAWPGRHQQRPAANPQTRVAAAGSTGAGGKAAGGDPVLAAPRAESGTPYTESHTAAGGNTNLSAPRAESAASRSESGMTAGGDADMAVPRVESAVCTTNDHGREHEEANAGAGASSLQEQQAPSHTHCVEGVAGLCEAVAPSSSAASAPNGGPFIFRISGIPLQLDRVRCRISLQLVPWADPDKQSLLLPDYEVQQGPIQPLPQDAHQATASLVPAAQQTSQTSQGENGGPQGAHASSAVSDLLAGLPSDFDVALTMDAAGVGSFPCHAHSTPHWWRAWHTSSKPEPLPKTGAGARPVGVGVKPEQEASEASQGQGPNEGPASGPARGGGVGPGPSKVHAAEGWEQTEGASQPPAAHADGAGESSNSSRSGAAVPSPTVAVTGQCFKVITYVSQEQHYNAAQVWEDFQANPPPVKLAKVRGAASEDRAQDAKRARGGASDQAGAEALAAGLRRSGRQRKPVQTQQQDTDTEDGDEEPGASAVGDWEPVPLQGDVGGSE